MIKFIDISDKEYRKLSYKERKGKLYCIIYSCIEYSYERKEWVINNKLHREDGPSIEYINGINDWFLNNIPYSFEEWCKILNKTDEEKIFLRLKYDN